MDKTNFFEHYYNNAVINSIVIISIDGIILEINKGFTNNFGFTNEDLKGKKFEELFTAFDRKENKPALELEKVIHTGQANDDGFLLNKAGSPVWCTGEIMLAYEADGTKILIKDVINLQARKHLNLFLKNTEELLDRIFHASKDIPMIIVDGSLKILDMNEAFIRFFEIEKTPGKGVSLSRLNNIFWSSKQIRHDLSQMVVTNNALSAKPYSYISKDGVITSLTIDTKTIFMHPDQGRRIFIIAEIQAIKMLIHFNHMGEKLSAKFSYNGNDKKDSITMEFENDFHPEIVFSKIREVWTSISDLQSLHPNTYVNIQRALFNYFEK